MQKLIMAKVLPVFGAFIFTASAALAQTAPDECKKALRNGATLEEALFADTGKYVSCRDEECKKVLSGFEYNPSVKLEFTVTPEGKGFTGSASLEDTVYEWDSENGGLMPQPGEAPQEVHRLE